MKFTLPEGSPAACLLRLHTPTALEAGVSFTFWNRKILFPGQPVMRQVDRSGSLPPRWVTKSFSACGVITTRRARHASPGKSKRSRAAAAARRATPRHASPRLALQHAHTHALTPLAFATAKQPSTRVSIQEPKGPDSNREPARPPPLAVHKRLSGAVPHIPSYSASARDTHPSHRAPAKEISCRARSHTPPESTPTPAALASSQVELRRSS